MALSHEHVGSNISAKIKICILGRAELLYTVCNEIPCMHLKVAKSFSFSSILQTNARNHCPSQYFFAKIETCDSMVLLFLLIFIMKAAK